MAGAGLSPDAALFIFPIDVFLSGSDISPLMQRRQELYDGLTRWTRKAPQAAASVDAMLCVEGVTYEDAFAKANDLLLDRLWGDGLPLWPPTPARVEWIMRGTALPRMHVLGKFPPRGGVTTIETCAIALAIAGGRPEYLPVLIAAVEAFLDPASNVEQLQAASGSAFPVVIVNGPIGRQIRLNSSFGCLGPDPQHPAGASIGRALRLMQQNVGGALPGIGTMASYGGMRYTNVVFAEDEEGLPRGWEPHGTERHGYVPGTNSVSLVFANGATNILRRGAQKESVEEDALQGMHRMADFMRTPNLLGLHGYAHGTPGILMIPRIVAATMTQLGWTKRSMREFLWEHSKIPAAQLRRSGSTAWIEINSNPVTRGSIKLDPWPITATPENLVLIVAGGSQPSNSYWMQGYCPSVIGREIHVPKWFERLLAAT